MSRSEADVRNALSRALTDAAISVVSQMTGASWANVEAVFPEESVTHVGIRFGVEVPITLSLDVPYSDCLHIASLFLGDTVEPAEDKQLTEEQTEILREFVRQVLGLAVSQLRPEFGELSPSVLDGTPSISAEVVGIAISDNSGTLRFGISIDSSNIQKLLEAATRVDDNAASANEVQSSGAQVLATEISTQPTRSNPTVAKCLQERNFDLLLDIELQVSLRFGRREMLLKDILELSSGSVVELDRLIQEPVDLLLDHKVIARGEVVVVEGNYGLRVTEVATPRQRIECLC